MLKKLLPFLIILFAALLFSPSLNTFFSSDDWYFLKISQVHSVSEFLNFFSFAQTPQSAPFYRPLSTQIFFFVFHLLFGLNVLPYRMFALLLFIASLVLVYVLAKTLLGNFIQAILILFFYAISAIHFTAIYFLSATQELFLIVFVLLSLIFALKKATVKNILLSTIFFILAMLSKETAVMIPALLLLILIYRKNSEKSKQRLSLKDLVLKLAAILKSKQFIILYIILIPYFYLKIRNPNPAVGNSYIFNWSPGKLANTSIWYILWSLGTPEMLVDYIGSGFHVVSKLFTDYPIWSKIILSELISVVLCFSLLILTNLKRINRFMLIGIGIFFLGLLPVIFFPWHKFSYYLTLPMVGFSLLLSQLINFKKGYKIISVIFLLLFLIINVSTIILDNRIHYSVNRGKISFKVFNYLKTHYSTEPRNSYFEFINDTTNHGVDWGSSKQIATAISQSNLCQVLYSDLSCQVFYQDYPEAKRPKNKHAIEISSKQFLDVQ